MPKVTAWLVTVRIKFDSDADSIPQTEAELRDWDEAQDILPYEIVLAKPVKETKKGPNARLKQGN
jgi:hypothetical protein